MNLTNLNFYKDYIFSCNRCKSCTMTDDEQLLPICPPFDTRNFFSYCGGGKAHIAQAIVNDEAKRLEEISEYFYKCTMCMACRTMCPVALDHYYLIRDVRQLLYENNAGISDAVKNIFSSMNAHNNPWELPAEAKGEWLFDLGVKDLRHDDAEVLYYVGCYSAYREKSPNAAENAVRILLKAGVDFGILGNGEICCGLPACDLGNLKLFKALAEKNLEKFSKLSVKEIIVSDPHCYSCFVNNYPEISSDMPPVVHITDFILQLVEEGKLTLKKQFSQKVTFHDPCRLGRFTDIYNAPRKILESVIQGKIIEMPRNRAFAYCCGNGIGVKETYPDLWEYSTGVRLAEAKQTEAELIITACPYCAESFHEFQERSGHNNAMRSVDLLHMVAASI